VLSIRHAKPLVPRFAQRLNEARARSKRAHSLNLIQNMLEPRIAHHTFPSTAPSATLRASFLWSSDVGNGDSQIQSGSVRIFFPAGYLVHFHTPRPVVHEVKDAIIFTHDDTPRVRNSTNLTTTPRAWVFA
jgi:hypothetical protein